MVLWCCFGAERGHLMPRLCSYLGSVKAGPLRRTAWAVLYAFGTLFFCLQCGAPRWTAQSASGVRMGNAWGAPKA